LFKDEIPTPKFSRNSRNAILTSGKENWSAINPDIFGSMFQAVISVDQRGSLGQHYTSVPNIMKVIEPLFLNDLYEELEKAGNNANKLNALLHRIHHLKIFDPACGSGNFLIIAYKELRTLEMKIFKAGNMMALSGIQLAQFYGIEIDDFAGEIAKLALWLAEHQMNVEFFKAFGRTNPTLPLREAGKIVQGNACRLDWEVVCPKEKEDEIYVLGNPPYLGFSLQNYKQKDDIKYVFHPIKGHKRLDYICCWFKLASLYILKSNAYCAFVSTNSITQGEQVSIFWNWFFEMNLEIFFAQKSFKWNNNAKSKAAVICVIIGICNKSSNLKRLYTNSIFQNVNNISPYLIDCNNTIVSKRTKPLSSIPPMLRGDMPIDGGNLLISSDSEMENLITNFPELQSYIRKFIGAVEFMNNTNRWCLWFNKDNLSFAESIPPVLDRLNGVRQMRLASSNQNTITLSNTPHLFGQVRHKDVSTIIIPSTTSERRDYIPMGFIESKTIISNLAYFVPCENPYLFGMLSSKMQLIWVKTVGGRLKSDYRYSSGLCYNTFPFPKISTQRKNEITQSVLRILEEREKHSDKTLADLYDPDKMPEGLRAAHRDNDIIIEKCYRSTPFNSDEERLEYLFKLYEKMIAEEQAQGTLFAKPKKTRKKKK
jgi:hypothetical protein